MANHRERLVVTNGDLGTENTWFVGPYRLDTWQGECALERWAQRLADKSGKPVWAMTYAQWDKQHTAKTPPAKILCLVSPAL